MRDTLSQSDLQALLDTQRAAFGANPSRTADERREDLRRIEDGVLAWKDRFVDAVSADFGCRAREETLISEIAFTRREARFARKNVGNWMKPSRAGVDLNLQPARARIRHEAKGVVGIVAPWNYPVQLALGPLVAALAAGNRVMLKPSEVTPHTSSVLAAFVKEHFSDDHVAVVEGGVEVAQAFTRLAFDHLFFTGSTAVGRHVAKAAAENLTPVTLELGGKSPAIIGASAKLETIAKGLVMGRAFSGGQTCVAIDYILCSQGKGRAIADAMLKAWAELFPAGGAEDAYTAIVSDRHFQRLTGMIEEARNSSALVLQPDHDAQALRATRKLPLTLVLNPSPDLALMQEEIFGPVLPIIEVTDTRAAIDHVNAGDRPLALYVYSNDKAEIETIVSGTRSGGVGVNAALLHLAVESLPFGGTGMSGQGAYHGRWGFDELTHKRADFRVPTWHPAKWIYPPYGKMFDFVLKRMMK